MILLIVTRKTSLALRRLEVLRIVGMAFRTMLTGHRRGLLRMGRAGVGLVCISCGRSVERCLIMIHNLMKMLLIVVVIVGVPIERLAVGEDSVTPCRRLKVLTVAA